MTIAATPRLFLCENLTLDFNKSAQEHKIIGTIWRVLVIVCIVAAIIFSGLFFVMQLKEPLQLLDAILFFGSFSSFTALAFRTFQICAFNEFQQCQFYQQVAKKEKKLQVIYHESQIKEFFAMNGIDYPTNPLVRNLLQKHVDEKSHFSKAFIPAIAHYKILQGVSTRDNSPIAKMQRGLDQLNLAMILQTMHRPTQNRGIKLDNRFTNKIPNVGTFDMAGVLKKISTNKRCFAFFFDRKEKKRPLTLNELIHLSPAKIRRKIFD
jgi:hypothetical protein